MPRRSPPVGFVLLGMAMALLAAWCAAFLGDSGGQLERFLFGLVAALSLAAAEALWWMRPWLLRAVDAWALACTGSVIVAGAAATGGFSLGGLLLLSTFAVAFVGMPCALVRWYVRGHAAVAGLLPARPPLPRTVP